MTELRHYGILGMKWGVRRYQNKDGTLTPAGRRRYDRAQKTISDRTRDLHYANTLMVTAHNRANILESYANTEKKEKDILDERRRSLRKNSAEYKQLDKDYWSTRSRIAQMEYEIKQLDCFAMRMGSLQNKYKDDIEKAKKRLAQMGLAVD